MQLLTTLLIAFTCLLILFSLVIILSLYLHITNSQISLPFKLPFINPPMTDNINTEDKFQPLENFTPDHSKPIKVEFDDSDTITPLEK